MRTDASGQWTENRATTGFRRLRLRELWEYRELTYYLALRDVKARYKQAFFGVAWALLQPVAGAALFFVVFHRLAGLPGDGLPYSVFALSGYLMWTYFATTLSAAAGSLVTNANLVTKVYFPRLAAPLATLLPALLNLAPGLVVLAALMAYHGVAVSAAVLLFPVALLWLAAVSLAFGAFLAALNVQYRDVGSLIGMLLQLWLFASPVAYPSSLITGTWQWVYALNPMVGVLDTLRWTAAGGPAPGVTALVSAGVTGLVLAGALTYFTRVERRFADVI